MGKKFKEQFTRKAVILNCLADLSRFITKLTLRASQLDDENDIKAFQRVQESLIAIERELENLK